MKTSPKPFCFVLMPFSKDFEDIYTYGIKGACEDAGVYCERVDEQIFTGSMLDRIYNQISRADLIVADMSGRNSNVFYEVGYAHALGKRTILLTQDAGDIPFDLKHFPHIVYGARISELRPELSKRVKWLAFESPSEKQYELGLEIYWRDKPLSLGSIVAEYAPGKIPNATLTVHNLSSKTYAPGDFQVGVLVPAGFALTRSGDVSVVTLPSGEHLHMLPAMDTIFPGAYGHIKFSFDSRDKYRDEIQVTVRVFSDAGFRDFPLLLRRGAEVEAERLGENG